MSALALSADVLSLDPARATERIAAAVREQVTRQLRRKGVVLGLSGGIDSSVAAALCARALGPTRVLGLLMPEADSSPDSTRLGRLVAERLGIEWVLEDVGPILTAAGCYRRRDDALRAVVPEYDARHRCKLVLPDLVATERYPVFSVVVRSPAGVERRERLTADAYLGVVAATNFKQRVRKMLEYYHADRRQYAVVGTPNRLEHDQGFFVKNGDGAADLKPIAHLYKSQVYALARHLGIPEEIQSRPATTDTYSLAQSQEEFYFGLPLATLDLAIYARDHGLPAAAAAPALGLSPEQVERVYRVIDGKRRAARYQHLAPLLVEPVEVPA
ncbi:MAG TPA: NAD(+) synthase [Methylomirabilota bacterium]|nr:NAD(+) synthase [Methylomirabilota bacterium]